MMNFLNFPFLKRFVFSLIRRARVFFNKSKFFKINSSVDNINFFLLDLLSNRMTFLNKEKSWLVSASKKNLLDFFKTFSLLLQPFAPHISEEIWKELKCSDFAINQMWPKISSEIKIMKSKIAVQINGKTRAILELKKGAIKEEVKKIAINDDKIQKHIQNKNIKKVIFVPEKIINIVI